MPWPAAWCDRPDWSSCGRHLPARSDGRTARDSPASSVAGEVALRVVTAYGGSRSPLLGMGPAVGSAWAWTSPYPTGNA